MLYLITGPPAAGKTTWVRERAKHGDITIDYDALGSVLTPRAPGTQHSGADLRELPKAAKDVTIIARQAAIDAAVKHSRTTDVYIIHATPRPAVLRRYRDLGAQIITIDPGRDVVLERCRRERSPRIEQIARQWYRDRQDEPMTTGTWTAADW